jgi:hypothetical protein
MKYFGLLIATLFTSLYLAQAMASPEPVRKKKPMGKLETNMQLSGSQIEGQKRPPMQLEVLAQDDKFIDDLVPPRKSFSDKRKQRTRGAL